MGSNPIIIGITGNYGSGKSSFCDYLRESGLTVISADAISQDLLDSKPNLAAIATRWGRDFVRDNKADRKKIAELVFNSPKDLAWLNQLLHPQVLAGMQRVVDESNETYLFFEVPLLFEAGMQRCFDYLILVRVDPEVRLKRLKKRDHATQKEILARLGNQIDDENKAPFCDLVVDNNSSPAKLKAQAQKLETQLKSIKRKDKLAFCL